MDKLLRYFFLSLSQNPLMKKLAQNHGYLVGANRFVAGSTIDEALVIIKQLNKAGLAVTVDHLGEFVTDEKEATAKVNDCIEIINRISEEQVNAQLSLKLTSLGLDINQELTIKNLRRIVNKAQSLGVFVTIDMEDYSRCQAILDVFTEIRKDYSNIGTVLQAYLYRTELDILHLMKMDAHLRLCKGAYKESTKVAIPEKKDVDKNFKRIIKNYLLSGSYTAIATHDDAIITYAKQLIKTNNISSEKFEFQMLYGIRPERQYALMQEGFKMRVYVPFGHDWFGYFMRRLAERPANVWFVFKNLFRS